MDATIFTGYVPIAELKRDKPPEYAELVANGELEKHLEAPQTEVVLRPSECLPGPHCSSVLASWSGLYTPRFLHIAEVLNAM